MPLSFLKLAILVLIPGIAGWLAFGRALKRYVCLVEALFLILLAGVATVSWLALLLAELGWFSLPLLAVLVTATSLCLAAWALWKRHGLDAFRGLRIALPSLTLLGIIGLAVVLPARPFEYILGGRDHGVYVNTGVNIARTGSIIFRDAELAALPAESQRAVILPEVSVGRAGLPGPWSDGLRLPGFALRDLEQGIIVPHALHLYPVWIAILYTIGGLSFALWVTFFFSLMGALGVYFAGTRLFGQPVGLLAAFLLLISVGQMWFARYPSAEIVVQFLFWAGLYAFVLMLTTHSRYAAFLAGVSFGLTHLAKLDIVFVPVVLLLFLVYLWLRGRFHRSYWFFLVPYALLLLHAGAHAFFISTIYTVDHAVRVLLPRFMAQALVRAAAGYTYPLDILSRLLVQNIGPIIVSLLALALVFLVARFRRTWSKGLEVLGRYGKLAQGALVLSLAFCALYTYFVQPHRQASGLTSPMVMVGWYVAPLGILLGTAGFLQAMGECAEEKAGFAWLMVVGNVVPLLIMGSRTAPDHFWAIRRFVPIVIPAFFLFASYLLWQLVPRDLGRWPRSILSLSLAAVLAINCWQASRPLARVVEYKGIIRQVSQFADSFSSQAVLLFEQSDAGNRMTAPLWLIFNKTVFMITEEATGDPALATAIRTWQADGRDVYWISTGGESPNTLAGLVPDYLSTHVLAAPLVETPVGYLPSRVGEYAAVLDVHRVIAAQEAPERREVLTLHVGQGTDDQYVSEGLYDAERIPGLTPNRWTGGRVIMHVPIMGRPAEVLLRMGNGRPPGVPAPEVSVYLDNHLVGTVRVEGSFGVYSLSVPEDAWSGDGTTELRLEMETWNPLQAGYNQDSRDLGVLLDWVKLVIVS
jgi:hypothetical protein